MSDSRRLACLHSACLPEDLLPGMGIWFLTRFYQQAEASASEFIATVREDGSIVAACMVTTRSGDLMSRVLRQSLTVVLWGIVTGILHRPAFGLDLFAVLRSLWAGDTGMNACDPQIVVVYVDPARRRTGLARKVIAQACAMTAATGASQLFVKTLDEPTSAAMVTYRACGFTVSHAFSFAARRYLMLRKVL